MKLLIAGGSGNIGRNLAKYIKGLDAKSQITMVTRNIENRLKFPYFDHFLTWTDLDRVGLPKKLDAVVCVTGLNAFHPLRRFSQSYEKEIYQSRVGPTKKLANLINSSGEEAPKFFISGSAISYYPYDKIERNMKNPFNERDILAARKNDLFSDLVHQWENSALLDKNVKTKLFYSRFGVVLSKESPLIVANKLAFKMRLGACIGTKEAFFHWIHIDDVCRAMMHLIEKNVAEGPINFVTPIQGLITNYEMAKTFAHVFNTNFYLNIPSALTQFLVGRQRNDLMFNVKNVIEPRRLIESKFTFRFNSLSCALRNLNE